MIISGGVNIYPQETENVLITHPKVADVAVIGVPERGVRRGGEGGRPARRHGRRRADALAQELIAYLPRAALGHVKCPRSIDFEAELPAPPHRQALQAPAARTATGKGHDNAADLSCRGRHGPLRRSHRLAKPITAAASSAQAAANTHPVA